MFQKEAAGSSEHLCFGLVLKDAKSLCLLKSTHHLSRKVLRKIYRMHLVLWANMKRFIRNKRNRRFYFYHVLKDHENQIAGMGVADLKQHEKTIKFICARILNFCLLSVLYDDKTLFLMLRESAISGSCEMVMYSNSVAIALGNPLRRANCEIIIIHVKVWTPFPLRDLGVENHPEGILKYLKKGMILDQLSLKFLS